MKQLTTAQRRTLKHIERTEQRTKHDWWHRSKVRYSSEYGIQYKLLRRGYLYRGMLELGNGAFRPGTWITDKGRKALASHT